MQKRKTFFVITRSKGEKARDHLVDYQRINSGSNIHDICLQQRLSKTTITIWFSSKKYFTQHLCRSYEGGKVVP